MCPDKNCDHNVVDMKTRGRGSITMCKADTELMKFAEIFEALPHGHADRLFEIYTDKIDTYREKSGKAEVTKYENFECFKDALREVVRDITSRQYHSVIND